MNQLVEFIKHVASLVLAKKGSHVGTEGTAGRSRDGARGPKHENVHRRPRWVEPQFCRGSEKEDGMPRGYPGAKIARKAKQGTLTKSHFTKFQRNVEAE